jgi:nucleotide-binding universal stress UspA family protein
MSFLLNNILVPVDFTLNSETAVKKAIELAQSSSSVFHLLHVKSSKASPYPVVKKNNTINISIENYNCEAIRKLQEWKVFIEERITEATVIIYFLEGVVHDKIVEIAKQIKPQLIIIAKKKSRSFFEFSNAVYPNMLAKSTACPVLTIMRESLQSKIKIIVVPVRSFIPYRKIELAIVFAKMDRAKIHVVTLQNKMAAWNTDRNYLIETYLLLKSRLSSTVEYYILNGTNLPKATLNYAETIGADMILANPWSETKIAGLTGRHINDLLTSYSKLQILSVEPY